MVVLKVDLMVAFMMALMVVLKVDLTVHLMVQRAPTNRESPALHMHDVARTLNNYMSPPAGDIYRSWLRVCPSVTLPLSGPYLLESYMYNFLTFSPNNILTEVVQQKIKIQIFPKILKFWPKKKT